MPTETISGPLAPRSSPGPASPTSSDFAALRDHLAQAGYRLVRVYPASGGPPTFSVSRSGLLRDLDGLDAVEQFAHQAGGAAA